MSSYVQEKFQDIHRKVKELGYDYNKIIQTKKAFRNPSIYEKLILHCDIDEFGRKIQRIEGKLGFPWQNLIDKFYYLSKCYSSNRLYLKYPLLLYPLLPK